MLVHGKIHEVENENVGVESGHKGEELAERGAGGAYRYAKRRHKLKPYRAAAKAEQKAVKANAEYPSTSFDCSGFVSWVLTNSGVCNTGRLGAQGLYNISAPVSNPQPGDLVFFTGTYDTPGVSHVGIYVGNSMMLHCGDPISYSNLNSSYWQSHFYAYARPPYN